MSHKDYETIAAALRAEIDRSHSLGSLEASLAVVRIASSLADAFEVNNPRFDPERFLQAAGVSS